MWRTKDTINQYDDGEIIVNEGEAGGSMFIIVSGAVKITKSKGDGDLELAKLVKGDYFGEMSLLQNAPRSATVTAVGTTRLMVLSMATFMLKIRRDPSFALSVMIGLSERLRNMTNKAAQSDWTD